MEKILIIIFLLNLFAGCKINGEDMIKNSNVTLREGYINVSGGKVWFKIEGAEKKGIPLLVLHGGPGAPHDYLEPLSKLSDERPVIFYDQLGCGNSDRSSDTSLWNVPRFVEELSIVISELHISKVHILGQSWGSLLVADYYITKKPSGVSV
jgi:proline iminopeptidase